MKKLLILIFSFSLLAPALASAESSLIDVNFCAALNQVRTESQLVVNQKEKGWQDNLNQKIKAGALEKDRIKADLALSAKKEDEVWAKRFAALLAAAQTEEEKVAATTLETKVKALISLRREKVKAAIEAKQNAKQALLTDYATQVREAVANFKVALNQEILQTQTACVSPKTDDRVVGNQFRADRDKLSQSLALTLKKIKDDATDRLTVINQTKDQAVNQAWTDFRASLMAEKKNRGLE